MRIFEGRRAEWLINFNVFPNKAFGPVPRDALQFSREINPENWINLFNGERE